MYVCMYIYIYIYIYTHIRLDKIIDLDVCSPQPKAPRRGEMPGAASQRRKPKRGRRGDAKPSCVILVLTLLALALSLSLSVLLCGITTTLWKKKVGFLSVHFGIATMSNHRQSYFLHPHRTLHARTRTWLPRRPSEKQ